MKKITQTQQVINVLRSVGGYATLRRLNEHYDNMAAERASNVHHQ